MSECEARRLHVPAQPFPDSHHIIPRAWQAAWAPNGAVIIHSGDAKGLWHPQTVELCPNCHRRVHVAIQQMMRASVSADTPSLAWDAMNWRQTREREIAYQALTEWVAAGGSLTFLRDRRLFGIQ